MTTTKLNLTRLAAGAVLQEGDHISFAKDGKEWKNFTQKDVIWTEPKPIQPHTYGRVILEGDLMNARYFRK